MSEQPLLPPPEASSESVVATSRPPQRNVVPWLYGLGFLILAAGLYYLWQYPATPSETTANSSALHNLEQQLTDMDARVKQLEQRPVVDVAKINSQIDAINAKINALDGKMINQTQLASRLDALSGRIESLSARDQTALDDSKQRLDGLTARISGLESNSSNLDAVIKRVQRVAQLQEASLALATGRPLGDLPDAPQSLAQYAHTAPPTEAALRLSFPNAEQAALAATPTNANAAPLVDRMWDRAQGLMTIRRGNSIVVGNPAATILGRAEAALDAGDLAGAVEAVGTLNGPPAQAMADWLAQAKGLLGAKAALAEMAGNA